MKIGTEIGRMQCASVVVQSQHRQQTDNGRPANGSERAEIADPFTQRKATNVQYQQKENDEERGAAGKGVAVGKLLDFRTRNVDRHANAGENHGG